MLEGVGGDVGDEFLGCEREEAFSGIGGQGERGGEGKEIRTSVRPRAGDNLQPDVFAFEAYALEVVICDLVWYLEEAEGNRRTVSDRGTS